MAFRGRYAAIVEYLYHSMGIEMSDGSDIKEEYFENQATDVEVENVTEEGGPDEPKPWDPDLIRIHARTFSLRQIVDMIEDADIDLAPDFQRYFVWKQWQKSRLIESILLGIPMPSFYFTEDNHAKMQVVDGLQRLSTVFGYARKKDFTLTDVEYLDEVRGLGFDDLSPAFRRRFNNTQIMAHVIDPQTPYPVKFDVFKRINTGGSPLNSQEIRHCMSGPKARELLKQCTDLEEFHKATGDKLRNHIRMADREVVLRFFAFRIMDLEEYKQHLSFDSFLGAAIDRIERTSDEERHNLVSSLKSSMLTAYAVFGDHAFRKWPNGDDRRHPVNRALFETWAVTFADRDRAQIMHARDTIISHARAAMKDCEEFIAAISQGTGTIGKVEYRFNKVREIVEDALQ